MPLESEVIYRVGFAPSEAYLGNPHKGCCTFQRFNGDPVLPGESWSEEGPLQFPSAEKKVADDYLPTTVAYCRWFWSVLEPEMGKYDFSMIDKSLEVCRQRGQMLAVRMMPCGAPHQVLLPDWYVENFPVTWEKTKGGEMHLPVSDAPEYLERWGGLIAEFGRRYDSNPLLESIDIAYQGPWGEDFGECSMAQRRRFAELWKKAFAHTPRLAEITEEQLRAGIETGSGWRCNCFGNTPESDDPAAPHHARGGFMYAYPRMIVKAGAQNAWQTAPVHLESCNVPMSWYRRGGDIDFIIEQGWKYHATYFMPKSTALPEPWLEKLKAFCRKLGYRFVYRFAKINTYGFRPGEFRFETWIENVGVAPIYRRYDFALRLRQGNREETVIFKDTDIRTWLPGDAWIDETVALPDGFTPGEVELATALIGPAGGKPRIRFAVKEQDKDGWVPLGAIKVP